MGNVPEQNKSICIVLLIQWKGWMAPHGTLRLLHIMDIYGNHISVVSLKIKHAMLYPSMLQKLKHWNLYQERQKQDTCLGPVNVSNPKARCLAIQPPLPQEKAGSSEATSLGHTPEFGKTFDVCVCVEGWGGGGEGEQLILGLWYKDRSRIHIFMPLWLFLNHPGKALLFRLHTHNSPGKIAGSESAWLPRLICGVRRNNPQWKCKHQTIIHQWHWL